MSPSRVVRGQSDSMARRPRICDGLLNGKRLFFAHVAAEAPEAIADQGLCWFGAQFQLRAAAHQLERRLVEREPLARCQLTKAVLQLPVEAS